MLNQPVEIELRRVRVLFVPDFVEALIGGVVRNQWNKGRDPQDPKSGYDIVPLLDVGLPNRVLGAKRTQAVCLTCGREPIGMSGSFQDSLGTGIDNHILEKHPGAPRKQTWEKPFFQRALGALRGEK